MGQKAIYNVLKTNQNLYPFKKQWSRSPHAAWRDVLQNLL